MVEDIGYFLGDTKEHCSTFKGTHTRAAIVFILGFWMLDLANNTLPGPARALLVDLAGPDQRNSANAVFCSWMAVGNILGFYPDQRNLVQMDCTICCHRWKYLITSASHWRTSLRLISQWLTIRGMKTKRLRKMQVKISVIVLEQF